MGHQNFREGSLHRPQTVNARAVIVVGSKARIKLPYSKVSFYASIDYRRLEEIEEFERNDDCKVTGDGDGFGVKVSSETFEILIVFFDSDRNIMNARVGRLRVRQLLFTLFL